MSTIQTYFTPIKDIVTILATGTATIVAIIGLQTWKKQLRVNAEYDLEKRVLMAVYKVKDAIRNCRIFMDPCEDLDKAKKQHEMQVAKLDDEYANLAVVLLEAMRFGEMRKITTSVLTNSML